MPRIFFLSLAGLLAVYTTLSQNTFTLSGKVRDHLDKPLPGAFVRLLPGNARAVTSNEGEFIIQSIQTGDYNIEVSFLGFQKYNHAVFVEKDNTINIQLKERMQTLQEVVVDDNYSQRRNREEPLNVEVVNDTYLKQNLGGSLMQSLERLPGISTIEIGAGQSKPVIRGLGFNRVVVVENGIKHEGQQWGADHGLEVDQFAFDRIEIIKGPASLLYGSEAIGGVIELKQVRIPKKHSIGGNIDLIGKSNNNLAGTSASVFGRMENLFFSLRTTLLGYADYRVPTDSIDIYSYRAPLDKNRLRNTAGEEQNLHFTAGFQNNGTSGRLNISNVQSKQGFFANTHGLEPRRVDNNLHDKSDRDIHMPYQEVSHLKITGRGAVQKEKYSMRTELGYQQNNRKEWSQYTRHGHMPPVVPSEQDFPAELERQFIKYIYTGNLHADFLIVDSVELSSGINTEYHDNRINGRGFIIPAYSQMNTGAFTVAKYPLSEHSLLQAGIRYDQGKLRTEAYSDWFTSPVETAAGIIDSMLQRAPALRRNFSNLSWSIGFNYNAEHLSFKLNAGKSFRMPIAKELAANGVNYHRFSYEKGNPDLRAERAYQLDAGIELRTRKFALGITPFVNYFPNYIYLNPGFEHDRLYGNGNQVFNYIQSKVLRLGGELHSHYDIFPQLKIGLILNYIHSEQLSGSKKGFTLPFSPPSSVLLHLKYEPLRIKYMKNPYVSLDVNRMAAQNRIVPPEEKTPGYTLMNLSAGTEIFLKNLPLAVTLQVQNLLNKTYFSHTSYYRLINVSGPARNVTLGMHLSF